MLLRDVLEHAVKLYGKKKAIFDGDVSYTYAETSERIHRLASALLGLGLEPGDHIAILANNSHRYLETYFVSDIAGMPLAPLNTRLAAHELEFILNDGEIKALILGPEFVPAYGEFKDKTPGIKHVILTEGDPGPGMLSYEKIVAAASPLDHSVREWNEDDMLDLCYTGGTTGLPKGVMLSQRNVVSNAQHAYQALSVNDSDVWLHVAPMFHLADAWACYTFTMAGGSHVFIPGFTPQGTLEAIQKYRVTKTILVPTMINFLLAFPDLGKYETGSINRMLFGASPMSVDRIMAATKVFGPVLFQAYGMTETAPLLTAMLPGWTAFDGSEADLRKLASCGREVAGVTVRVVNPETHEEVQPGEVGEIVARGPNIMLGYWRRGPETEEALRGGWMHTGDLATVDEENYVYIVDRSKDMIISGGENVYTTEVENAIYEHPDVLEVAVIGIPDDRWGEAVLAVVVPRPETSPTEEAIVEHCRKLIAGYKCPKQVVFRSEALPKSGPGKILKAELRKPYWEKEAKGVN